MAIKTKQDIIEDYIQQFRQFGTDVVDCFSNGMCYHFSLILCARFRDSAWRVYDPITNHFAVDIDGRIYDITGDITDDPQYKWQLWDSYQHVDPLHTEHIRRDCMWKVPSGTVICEFCEQSYEDDWGTLICGLDNSPKLSNDSCEKGENK